MKVVLSDKIYIRGLPEIEKEILREKFTYKNPLFGALPDEKPFIRIFEERNGEFILPRGVLSRLDNRYEIEDRTVKNPAKFKQITSIKLRDYQAQALATLTETRHGVLQAPCGSGKTVIMVFLIQKLGQQTLVLVDELKLQKQWQTMLEDLLGIRVGLIGDGKFCIEPVTVATIQTLFRTEGDAWELLRKRFGLVIVDECHVVPARTVFEVVNKTTSYYRFGTTATPRRRDRLEFLLFDSIGPIVHKIKEDELERESVYIPVVIIPVFTGVRFQISEPPTNFQRRLYWRNGVLSRLVKDSKRNELIVENVLHFVDGLHLVLSERVEHCKILAEMLKEKGKKVELLIGEIRAKERERIRKDETLEVIVGTSVADKGLDIPRIKYIHLTIPTTNKNSIIQRTGRGRRPFGDKEYCYVFDYIDEDFYFKEQFKVRAKIYKSKNFLFSNLEKLLVLS